MNDAVRVRVDSRRGVIIILVGSGLGQEARVRATWASMFL